MVERTQQPSPKGQVPVRVRAGALPYVVDWSRRAKSTGYYVVRVPEHPRAWSTGYVYEHILVVEAAVQRLLRPGEVVHHRNHDKFDNALGNLELLTSSAHTAAHNVERGVGPVHLDCEECGKSYTRPLNQTAASKGFKHHYCSRSCAGAGSWRVRRRR